jgi:hypothetical protein
VRGSRRFRFSVSQLLKTTSNHPKAAYECGFEIPVAGADGPKSHRDSTVYELHWTGAMLDEVPGWSIDRIFIVLEFKEPMTRR